MFYLMLVPVTLILLWELRYLAKLRQHDRVLFPKSSQKLRSVNDLRRNMAFSKQFGNVGVTLLPRAVGGWLAVSAPGSALKIGVVGSSEQDAVQRFERALAEWTALWDEQTVSRETSENRA